MCVCGGKGEDVCVRVEGKERMYVYVWRERKGCMCTCGGKGEDVCMCVSIMSSLLKKIIIKYFSLPHINTKLMQVTNQD